MNTECTFDSSGNLINIGPWQYDYTFDADGHAVITNPIPAGAYSEQRDVVTNEDGSRSLVN